VKYSLKVITGENNREPTYPFQSRFSAQSESLKSEEETKPQLYCKPSLEPTYIASTPTHTFLKKLSTKP